LNNLEFDHADIFVDLAAIEHQSITSSGSYAHRLDHHERG